MPEPPLTHTNSKPRVPNGHLSTQTHTRTQRHRHGILPAPPLRLRHALARPKTPSNTDLQTSKSLNQNKLSSYSCERRPLVVVTPRSRSAQHERPQNLGIPADYHFTPRRRSPPDYEPQLLTPKPWPKTKDLSPAEKKTPSKRPKPRNGVRPKLPPLGKPQSRVPSQLPEFATSKVCGVPARGKGEVGCTEAFNTHTHTQRNKQK